MASPLNRFKSLAANVSTIATNIYTAPPQTTSIILLAQVTNTNTSVDANVTFYSSLNGNTELAKDFTIPIGDAASLISGKLVLEANSSVGCFANANSALKLTLSILETT